MSSSSKRRQSSTKQPPSDTRFKPNNNLSEDQPMLESIRSLDNTFSHRKPITDFDEEL